jgi:hypothetical protein
MNIGSRAELHTLLRSPVNQAICISLQLFWSVRSEFHPVISCYVHRNMGSDNLHWQQTLRLEAKTAVGRIGKFPTFFLAASLLTEWLVIVVCQLLYPCGKRPLYPSHSGMLVFVSNGTIPGPVIQHETGRCTGRATCS